MTYFEMFQAELRKYNVYWCWGGCGSRQSHKRGFAPYGSRREIHLDSKITTRAALHRGLHELGHAVLHQYRDPKKRRFQIEAEAEAFAAEKMRELGVSVPRKVSQSGQRYVARMKRFGDRVRDGRRKASRPVVRS